MKHLNLFSGLLAGAGIYCYLMWYQTLGVNAVVFSILLITVIFVFRKELRKDHTLRFLALAFFVSTIGVAVNGITFGKCMYYLSMLLFLGFVQVPILRSPLHAAGSFIINFFAGVTYDWQMTMETFRYVLRKKKPAKKSGNRYAIIARVTIAFILVAVFFIIFITANPHFRKICENIILPLEHFFNYVLEHIQFWDIIHYGFVFYFLSLFFIRFKSNAISRHDATCEDSFRRERRPLYSSFLTIGLKEEYKTALLSIFLINLLLLGMNISDIFSVWLGIVPDSAMELSDFVHTGTYALIFSTLLSIGILLFYFRQNLNVYSENKRLKQLSYIWIIQNAFLLCSVGLRNLHYIGQCGLTYKRIGVFIFLTLTAIALYFLYMKISRKKSLFYYFRTCGWGVFCTLLVSGLINWDVLIANYNTSRKDIVTDYGYIALYLSEQALMYLPEDKLENQRYSLNRYLNEIDKRDWQSFTWWDYWATKILREKYHALPEEIPVVKPISNN